MKKIIGVFIEKMIQLTIIIFGKTLTKSEIPYLIGPIGEEVIGEDFYKEWCIKNEHRFEENIQGNGLIPDFNILKSETFNPSLVQAEIVDFYQKTSDYEFDIWSHWNPYFKIGASILVQTVSHHIQQLNFPLHAMDACKGMSSELITIRNKNGKIPFRCWLRKQMPSNQIIYCGFYIPYIIPSINAYGIKTVFPLPQGASVVLLEPLNTPEGGFKLDSFGSSIGSSGFYRIHKMKNGKFKVLMAPIKESLDISVDEKRQIRVEHMFKLFGFNMLHLHFKIYKKN